jgi:DNA transposition AAA+ family ATPase
MAITKNVIALRAAYEALLTRAPGIPGIGLVHGNTGYGKTTAIAYLINQVSGVYVRAMATWTPSAMLGAIMQELGAEPLLNRSSAMVSHIISTLAQANRPLFVDEADYLFGNLKMLETLRDIQDASGCPVVIIGMAGIERRLIHRPQFARRVSQWVEFLPSDLDDARTVTSAVCEIDIEDDLLARLHEEAAGNIGLIVVGLARVEQLAKTNGWKKVDAERWGNKQLFLSRAPKLRSVA